VRELVVYRETRKGKSTNQRPYITPREDKGVRELLPQIGSILILIPLKFYIFSNKWWEI